MQALTKTFSGFCPENEIKFSMHGLHSRYPEEQNTMSAVNHKLLEQVKVVAKEVNFHKRELLDVRTCSYGSGMDAFILDTWDWCLLLRLNLVNIDLCFAP